jgi:deoxycytidine triphosphate deaminase
MLLSYNELMELREQGVISCPEKHVNGASIDITLSSLILIEKAPPTVWDKIVYPSESINLEEYHITPKGFALKPRQFILAASNEVFNLPPDIACMYKQKSSLARIGLEHLEAGWCDPGWKDSVLTLELFNCTQYHHIMLTPNMKIGQMVFFKTSSKVPGHADYAARGQYNNQTKVTKSKGAK